MKIRTILLASVATFALSACGNGDETTSGASSASNSKSAISAANPSKGSPFDASFKLKSGSELDIDALMATMGVDGPKPYGSASFDKSIGATIINDIKFDDGDGNIVTIEKAELFGVDEAAIDRVINGTAAIDSPFESVLQKVRLYNVNFQLDESEFGGDAAGAGGPTNAKMTLGGLEIDQLKIRQGGVDKSAGENTMVAQAFNVFDLGGLYFKDYDVEFGSKEIGEFTFKAPDFRIVGVNGGKLNAMIANDLEYSIKQSKDAMSAAFSAMGPQGAAILDGPLGNMLGLNGQRLKAKTMTWNDIDASGLLAYGLKGEMPPMSARNLISLGRGEIINQEQFVGGKKLMSAKLSTFEMDEFTWLIPNKIRSDVKDATYDLTAYVDDEQTDIINSLKSRGLDKVKGEGFMTWDYNEKTGNAEFGYGGKSDKLVDFSVSMDAGNLKFDEIANLVESENQEGLAGLGNFSAFNMKITDKNLLNVVYDVAAIQMGAGSGDDLRQSAPAMLRLSSGQITAINPLFEGYVDALASFLGEGGTLEISAKPEDALPFMQLGLVSQTAPQTLPDVMNLTVKHSK